MIFNFANTGNEILARKLNYMWTNLKDMVSNLYVAPLHKDAWGRVKTIHDVSLFSGLFTYDVPPKVWKEFTYNGVDDYDEKFATQYAVSTHGTLHLTSPVLNERTQLRAKSHNRYQPNRGILYSNSAFFPNPTARSSRMMGMFLPKNGFFFDLVGDGTDWKLYFVIRNDLGEDRRDITDKLPKDFDIEKGNLYDVQVQWRGVGDFFVYVNQELIYQTEDLGTRTHVSIENPSLPAAFEVRNQGDDAILQSSCVDVTTEGGGVPPAKAVFLNTGEDLLLTTAHTIVPMLLVKMPKNIMYNGEMVSYTRDAIFNRVISFAKDESSLLVYASRAVYTPNLAALSTEQSYGSYIEIAKGGAGSALETAFNADKAFLRDIMSVRHEKDFAFEYSKVTESNAELILEQDDIVVFALKTDGNSIGGVTVELSEQV